VALLIVTACLLYWAKTKMQAVYGAAEFVVGLLSCWIGLAEQKKDDLAASLAIIGGVYILVRACENVSKGIKPLVASPRFPKEPVMPVPEIDQEVLTRLVQEDPYSRPVISLVRDDPPKRGLKTDSPRTDRPLSMEPDLIRLSQSINTQGPSEPSGAAGPHDESV
jgi:hypothetical protein